MMVLLEMLAHAYGHEQEPEAYSEPVRSLASGFAPWRSRPWRRNMAITAPAAPGSRHNGDES